MKKSIKKLFFFLQLIEARGWNTKPIDEEITSATNILSLDDVTLHSTHHNTNKIFPYRVLSLGWMKFQ